MLHPNEFLAQIEDRVVVGSDGSDHAQVAVDWAARYAADAGAGLTIVSVYSDVVPPASAVLVLRGEAHTPEDWAEALCAATASRVRRAHPDLDVDGVAVPGRPVAILGSAAAVARAVVTGSRGLGGVRGALQGSVSNALAGRSEGPVIVVRADEHEHAGGPVVLGLDGHEGASAATRFAFEEARRRGVSLLAVGAWSAPGAEGSRTDVEAADARARREVADMLERRVGELGEEFADVAVEVRVVHDRAAEALVDASREASMVVVTTRTRGALAALVVGSTSRELLRKSQCPAAVVSAAR